MTTTLQSFKGVCVRELGIFVRQGGWSSRITLIFTPVHIYHTYTGVSI